MSRRRPRKSDGLQSKVSSVRIQLDEEGNQFIPYCLSRHHIGVVEKPEVCNSRQCDHYRRVYVESIAPVYKRGELI